MLGMGRTAVGTIDWDQALRCLEMMERGPATDDFIDSLTSRILSGELPPAGAAVRMLQLSSHPFTIRASALATGLSAAADDQEAVDALVSTFKQYRDDGFLAASILDALGLLALRNPLARTEVASILLRLKSDEDRYLLIRAAKVIGRIEYAFGQMDLLRKLKEFVTSDDLAVQAEARQQLALVEFSEVLLSGERADLWKRIASVRAAFDRARLSEEHRPDAAIFVCLLDSLLTLQDPDVPMSEAQRLIGGHLQDLKAIINGEGPDGLQDYRSADTSLLVSRVLEAVDSLHKATHIAAQARDWLNLEESLLHIATVYAVIVWRDTTSTLDRRHAAISAIAPAVLAPRFGPVLQLAVGRHKLNLAIERYRLRGGEEDVLAAMEALQDHVSPDGTCDGSLPVDLLLRLDAIAATAGVSPDELLRQMLAALRDGRLPEWTSVVGMNEPHLLVERPTLYGADPNIDEVVRPLLHQLVDLLGDYGQPKLNRLIQAVEEIVAYVKSVRDDLPDWVKSREDGGLGQSASEDDLKKDLFKALRGGHGKSALYEIQGVAGGRPDTGLRFDECDFPVETKHSFESIEASHIRNAYLVQADIYAASRDRVAFLLVLDLRAGNAGSHVKVRGSGKKSRTADMSELHSLYSLRDSFWIEHLSPDPDLPQAKPAFVIVGLVPGNRCLPSSTTIYSKRPAARC